MRIQENTLFTHNRPSINKSNPANKSIGNRSASISHNNNYYSTQNKNQSVAQNIQKQTPKFTVKRLIFSFI